jgi:hypothetical protein
MARRQGGAVVSGMIRYRPIVQNREVKMVVDESGDWTSLTCYYTLHDRVVRLQAEVDRLTNLLEAATIAVEANKNLVKQLKDRLEKA